MNKKTILSLLVIILSLSLFCVFFQGCGGGSFVSNGSSSSSQKGYVDIEVTYPKDNNMKAVSYYLIDIFNTADVVNGTAVVPTTRIDFPQTRARITDVPVGKKWVRVLGNNPQDVTEYFGKLEIMVNPGENSPQVVPVSPVPTGTPTPTPTVSPTPTPTQTPGYYFSWTREDTLRFREISALTTNSTEIFVANIDSTPPFVLEGILVLDMTGVFSRVLVSRGTIGINHPGGITIDTSNNIYIADTDNSKIKKFDQAGALLGDYGAYDTTGGTGGGTFRRPYGVAYSAFNNSIYVLDTENNPLGAAGFTGMIQRFDANSGIFQSQVNIPSGSPIGNFCVGIDVDTLGNLYVTDNMNGRILKFDSNLNLLGTWGPVLNNGGSLIEPFKITIDRDNNSNHVFVTDKGSSNVIQLDPNGNFMRQFGGSTILDPTGITVDSNSNIYVGDIDSSALIVRSKLHKFEWRP